MPTVLVTGANRGMGLEHVRQYADDGWTVLACCRSPDQADALKQISDGNSSVSVFRLDLTVPVSINQLKSDLGQQPIDVLLSNASHLGNLHDQRFGDMNYETFLLSYQVNALGPYKLAEALIENVRASSQKKMMFMSSTGGSISALQPPVMLFAYCPAKAALNSFVRGLYLNLVPEGITVGLLEPGVVDTQGFAKVKDGDPAPHGLDVIVDLVKAGKLKMDTPADAVKGLRERISKMTPDEGGVLTRIDGSVIPW